MTATEIAREAQRVERQRAVPDAFRIIGQLHGVPYSGAVPRFPAAVRSHPAFTRNFNARLVAVGWTPLVNKHRRLGG